MKTINTLFNEVVATFQSQYPNRDIRIVESHGNRIVCIDGQPNFCITGYNLLHNLQRLTEALKDELI